MEEDNVGCNKCGKCCYLQHTPSPVSLSIIDIWRIKGRTGLTESEFTQSFVSTQGSHYRTFKHVPDEKGDMRCTFLKDNDDGTKTCSIYKFWPHDCDLYPLIIFTHLDRICKADRIIYPDLVSVIKKVITAKYRSIKSNLTFLLFSLYHRE